VRVPPSAQGDIDEEHGSHHSTTATASAHQCRTRGAALSTGCSAISAQDVTVLCALGGLTRRKALKQIRDALCSLQRLLEDDASGWATGGSILIYILHVVQQDRRTGLFNSEAEANNESPPCDM
jgi:hypothetical protein